MLWISSDGDNPMKAKMKTQKKSVNQNLTLKKSDAEFQSRINKFGCTLFAELCKCNTWAIPPIVLN